MGKLKVYFRFVWREIRFRDRERKIKGEERREFIRREKDMEQRGGDL